VTEPAAASAAAAAPAWRARLVQRVRRQARRILDRVELRRAEAVRRRPASLVGRLRRARCVLVLCQGNVSRSVLAAQMLSLAAGPGGVSIRSAGLGTVPGWRAHADGSNPEQVTKDPNFRDWFPHFSPDGKWIAFVSFGLDVAPTRHIEPRPGRLVLFPSTMWHGTVPFTQGERLTVAFDVQEPITPP